MPGLFDSSNLSQTKRMFEGKGRQLNPKFKQIVTCWEDAVCLVASNGLPNLAEDPKRCYDWGAIKTRCYTTKLEHTHALKDQFPFTALDLAYYMHACAEQEAIVPCLAPPQELGKRRTTDTPRIDRLAVQKHMHVEESFRPAE